MTSERIKALKKFGITLGTAFGLLDAILLWKQRPSATVFLVVSLTFFIAAFTRPAILDKVEIYWMRFAERLSVVMTFVILTITFFGAILPLGLMLRLIGKDLLSLKLDRKRESYWIDVPADSPGSRPFLPY